MKPSGLINHPFDYLGLWAGEPPSPEVGLFTFGIGVMPISGGEFLDNINVFRVLASI
jgi:hypothetical protein